MMKDNRYLSGSSLQRTRKEIVLDHLDGNLGELSDELRSALNKLPYKALDDLNKVIAQVLSGTLDEQG